MALGGQGPREGSVVLLGGAMLQRKRQVRPVERGRGIPFMFPKGDSSLAAWLQCATSFSSQSRLSRYTLQGPYAAKVEDRRRGDNFKMIVPRILGPLSAITWFMAVVCGPLTSGSAQQLPEKAGNETSPTSCRQNRRLTRLDRAGPVVLLQ